MTFYDEKVNEISIYSFLIINFMLLKFLGNLLQVLKSKT